MTREESWGVQGEVRTLLRHLSSLGYIVSVHRLPASLLGCSGAFVEMHAVDTRTDSPIQQIARVGSSETANPDYSCAVVLAEMIGIDLQDG